MDLFLSDALDLAPGQAVPPGIVDAEEGSLDALCLLRSGQVRESLAFGKAWHAAVGVLPSRQAFWEFNALNRDLAAALSKFSPIRLWPHAQTSLKNAREAHASLLESLSSDDDGSRARDLLRAKFADRFGSPLQPRGENVVDDYARAVLHPEALRVVGLADSGCERVDDYYERSRSLAAGLGLPDANPLSGNVLAPTASQCGAERSPTVVEQLRHAVFSDVCLWRRSVGRGALVLLEEGKSRVRVPRGLPIPPIRVSSSLLRAALPASQCPFGKYFVESESPTSVPDTIPMFVLSSNEVEMIKGCENFVVIGASPQLDSECVTSVSRSLGGIFVPAPTYWSPSEPSWAAKLYDRIMGDALSAGSSSQQVRYLSFMASYAAVRSLGDRVFRVDGRPRPEPESEVLIVDTRANVMSVLGLLVTLDNLRCSEWSVTVVCSSRNIEFMRAHIEPQVPGVRFELLPAEFEEMSVEAYSDLMKSSLLWESPLRGSERVLLVQDDGVLVRPGLEAMEDVMRADYVGAPWSDADFNAEVKSWTKGGMVGNGGLSLRRTAEMRRIAADPVAGRASRRLYAGGLHTVPEDVFFAHHVTRPVDVAAAQRFAMEQRVSERPLGFHKPWPYHKPEVIRDLFSQALEDAAARS